jgi:parallel beta-helix repeat protein
MKKIIFLLIPFLIDAATLEEKFLTSGPGMGYDHLLFLEKDSVYTGGITINSEAVSIKGNGAIIDLAGNTIYVSGLSTFEIDGCVLKNGDNAIYLTGDAKSRITQCTFYGNNNGILCDGHFGMVEVVNSIFSNNSYYGFACCEETARKLHYIDMYQNALGDYVEWCPG